MKALVTAATLLMLAIVGCGIWIWLTAAGTFKPDPKVEIVVQGGTNGTLKVAVDKDFWPYSFLDGDGTLTGREVEMINAIANHLGVDLELKALSWSKCIDAALAHEVDMVLSCDESSGGREREALIMTTPIESDHYEVFGREEVSSLDELRGRRIGQMTDGNVNATLIAAGLGEDMVMYPSYAEAFKAMERGEVDFTITRDIQGRGCLKKHPVEGVEPRMFAGKSYFCVGVDKRRPELAAAVNNAISVMRIRGDMRRISDKWLTTYVEPDDLGEVVAKQRTAVAAFLLMLAMLVAVHAVLMVQRMRISRELERQDMRARIIKGIVKAASWMVKFDADRNITGSVYSKELKDVIRNDVETDEDWMRIIHPDDLDRAVKASLAVLKDPAGESRFDTDYRILSRTGEYHWVRSAGRTILNADGSGEMFGMCFDIDEHIRHRDERQRELEQTVAELKREKARAEIIRDTLHSALWRFQISADDRIVGYEFSRDIAKLVKNEKASDTYDWNELVHPEDLEKTLNAFRATLKDRSCRTPYDVIFRMIDRDGNYNWFRSAGNMVRYADGSGEFFGVHGDVTATMRERAAAQAKDEILVEVVKARYGYNVTVDLKTMKCSVISGVGCDGAVKVFERCSTYKEVVEEFNAHVTDAECLRKVNELFAADSILKLAAAGRRGYIGSADYPTISMNPNEEGSVGWRQVHLFIGTDASGAPIANLLGRNITAEREQADAREKLQAAEQANKAKSEFLFGMSHDIRTPMHAIMGFVDVAMKNLDDRQGVKDCLVKIQKSGELLFSLLNSVLDMSRLEVGKVKVVETPGDVYYSFDSVRSTMTEFAKEKSISLEFGFGKITDRYVYTDQEKASRIFVNIISNAIKYTEPGGWVRVTCEQVTGNEESRIKNEELRKGQPSNYQLPSANHRLYRYTFEDNGVGMSEEFQKHIYERFAREENTVIGDVRGIGLGMSICKGFVDLIGGKIECRSEHGKGTTFTVTLPFRLQEEPYRYIDPETGRTVEARDAEKDGGQEATKAAQTVRNFTGKRVLLVDDSMFNREVSRHYLAEAGFEVDTAENGQEALEKVKARHEAGGDYAVIMMDIQMPVMGGYEATRAIREWESRMAIDRLTDSPNDRLGDGGAIPQSVNGSIQSVNQTIGKSVNSHHIPIIAWSANAFEEDREASLAAGMDDHIAKGANAWALREVIAKHISG